MQAGAGEGLTKAAGHTQHLRILRLKVQASQLVDHGAKVGWHACAQGAEKVIHSHSSIQGGGKAAIHGILLQGEACMKQAQIDSCRYGQHYQHRHSYRRDGATVCSHAQQLGRGSKQVAKQQRLNLGCLQRWRAVTYNWHREAQYYNTKHSTITPAAEKAGNAPRLLWLPPDTIPTRFEQVEIDQQAALA